MKYSFIIISLLLFSGVVIAQQPAPTPLSCPAGAVISRLPGQTSALDTVTPDTQGYLHRYGFPDNSRAGGKIVYGAYWDSGGNLFTAQAIIISGHYTGGIDRDGNRVAYIKQGGITPAMLDLWADTMAAANFRANEQPGAFNLNSMNAAGETTFILEANGDHRWGKEKAASWDKRPMLDTSLGRVAPGVLATPGTLRAEAFALGADITITRGYGKPKGSCRNGSEYTQLDDGGRKFFCRGGNWMRVPLRY